MYSMSGSLALSYNPASMKKSLMLLLVNSALCISVYSQEVFAVDSINRTLTPVGSRY